MKVKDVKLSKAKLPMTIKQLQKTANKISLAHGWWIESNVNIPEKLALIHSEVSEALECFRASGMRGVKEYSVVNSKPEGFFVELCDAIIRIADLAEHYNIDLEELLELKMKYNSTRPYRHGGKAC